MKTSKEILPIEEREQLKGNYSPIIDRAIEALEAAEAGRIEPEVVSLKVRKWYKFKHVIGISHHLYLGNSTGVGFTADGEFTDFVAMYDSSIYEPADMNEVKRLLIDEAKKRGFKDGVEFKSASLGIKREFKGEPCFHPDQGLCLYGSNYEGCVFDADTGQWAEIVKEPLTYDEYMEKKYKKLMECESITNLNVSVGFKLAMDAAEEFYRNKK